MPVEHSRAPLRGAAVLTEENQSIYGALLNTINLSLFVELEGITLHFIDAQEV